MLVVTNLLRYMLYSPVIHMWIHCCRQKPSSAYFPSPICTLAYSMLYECKPSFHILLSANSICMLCRSRRFQYGAKYWICNALVLCGALIVSDADKPNHLASWHPLFLVATVNVVFSEKVTRVPFVSCGQTTIFCVACRSCLNSFSSPICIPISMSASVLMVCEPCCCSFCRSIKQCV